MSHLQVLEEDLVDSHRSLIVNMQQWASDDAALLAATNEVDYDQDGNFAISFLNSEQLQTFSFFFQVDLIFICARFAFVRHQKAFPLFHLRVKLRTIR